MAMLPGMMPGMPGVVPGMMANPLMLASSHVSAPSSHPPAGLSGIAGEPSAVLSLSNMVELKELESDQEFAE